jgi:hypothetical protein
VTGHPSEFQRQIIPSTVDLGVQDLQIPDVLASKPAQQLAKEDVLYEVFAGARVLMVCGIHLDALWCW